MERQQDYVLRTVEERGVRFIQLWFTDVLGTPKTFNITPAELETALEEGMTFDGSAIDGFSRVQESDVLAQPDPKTFQLLPYLTDGTPVARVVCDIVNLDGTPFEGDPRHVLRRALEKARERGFSFYCAPELEFFYFDEPPTGGDVGLSLPVPLDHGTYFELTTSDEATQLRRNTVLTLEDMGIPVEYSQHEDSPSQHEIDLRYTDALTMADNVMTVRQVVKEIASQHGILATFMPKPLAGVQGSGMHTHLSLFDGDTNAFHDEGDEYHLSEIGRRFIAGLLTHAPEITAVTNQWVNSYKRLIVGYEAPSTSRGLATTARPSSGSRPPSGARRSRPASSTGPPIPPPTPTWLSPPSSQPAWPGWSGVTPCRPRRPPTCTSSPPSNDWRKASPHSPHHWRTP